MNESYSPEREPDLNEEKRKNPDRVQYRMIEGNPIATYVLMAVTVLVYLMQGLSKWRYGTDYPLLYGAKYGPYITLYHEYWRLITPVGHSRTSFSTCTRFSPSAPRWSIITGT